MDKNDFSKRVFDARIACIDEIGLNGAIILQQIEYWLEIVRQQAATDEEIKKRHFHKGRYWIYNTFDQWQEQFPFWGMRTIKREFNRLEKTGVLLTGRYNIKGYDQTKWYSISKKRLETLINTHSAKMAQWRVPKWHNAECQNGTTNTKEYNKEYNKDYFKRDFFPQEKKLSSFEIIKKQLEKICDKEQAEYCLDILEYYFDKYKSITGKDHPHIPTQRLLPIAKKLCGGTKLFKPKDTAEWKRLIDRYFDTKFENCDYHINHFLSDEIIDHRFYEEFY